MNFKKMFGIVATVAMMTSMVPVTTFGYAVSDDMQAAYDYAYEVGVTTKDSAETANLTSQVTRAEMAKMITVFAEDVLGLVPNASDTECAEFTDVSSAQGDLEAYITSACQLGLMGRNNDGTVATKFNPAGNLTRAQYGTLLSRALYGDVHNGGNPRYADHLTALNDDGIMTNISNPNVLELRRWVMKTLQTADESGVATAAGCNDPLTIAACAVGDSSCPAACQPATEVKAGTLSLSSIGVDYTSIPRVGDVVFGSMKLTAASENITVDSIKIKLQGLVSVSDLGTNARVYFEKDGVRVSSRTSFNSTDKTALVTFTNPLVVKSSETLDVVLSLTAAATGSDIQLVSTDVDCTAQDINGSFTSETLRTSSYAVTTASLANDIAYYNNTKTVRVDADALVTLGGLKITKTTPTDRAVLVKAVTLNNSGNASLGYLEEVALYRDDIKVSTKTTIDGRTISFVLGNEIKTTETNATYVIKGKVNGADRINDVYDLYVKNATDVVAVEKDTAFRIQNSNTPSVAYAKIAGGDLKFNENTVASLTVNPGAKKVQFYSGTLTALQQLRLDTLTGVTLTLPAGTTALSQVLDNLYVQIGSSVISASTLATSTSVSFEGEVTVNGTVPFIIYGDIKSDYTSGGFLQFTQSISTSQFSTAKYVSDDSQAASIGSIGGRKATISTSNLSLTNSASAVNAQKGDRNVEIAKLEFATNSDITIRLSSFALTVDVPTSFKDSQVTLYDEAGTAISSAVLRTTGTAQTLDSFTMSPIAVSKGNPVKFVVKLDQVPNTVIAGDLLTGYVKTGSMVAKDIVSSVSVYPLVDTATTTITVTSAGNPTIVSQIYTPALVKYGVTNATLGSIDLKATNGNVVMRDAWFEINGLNVGEINQINSLKLLENDVVISSSLSKTGNYVYATNLNRTLTSTPKTYKVVADISTINNSASAITSTPTMKMYANTTTGGIAVDGYTTFESVYGNTGVVVDSTFGTGLATQAKNMSSTIKFVNEVPTITAVSSYVNGGDLVYKVTLNSTKLTQLTGVSLSVSPTNLSGYSSATAKVFVAANDSTYATNNYLTGTAVATLASLTALTTDVNINGSTTVYFIFQGLADLEPTNAQADRKARIELTNISYADNFDTGKASNIGMLTNYKASIIAPSLILSNTLTW